MPPLLHLKNLRLPGGVLPELKVSPGGLYHAPPASRKGEDLLAVLQALGQRRLAQTLPKALRLRAAPPPLPEPETLLALAPSLSLPLGGRRHPPWSRVADLCGLWNPIKTIWLKEGKALCPRCQTPVTPLSAQELVTRWRVFPGELLLGSPLTGDWREARRHGFRWQIQAGTLLPLQAPPLPERPRMLLIDRIPRVCQDPERLEEAVYTALQRNPSLLGLWAEDREEIIPLDWLCPRCQTRLTPPHDGLLSPQLPEGACSACAGSGQVLPASLERQLPLLLGLEPDTPSTPDLPGIPGWYALLVLLDQHHPRHLPLSQSSPQARALVEGDETRPGLKNLLAQALRLHLPLPACPACHGSGLNPQARLMRWRDVSLEELLPKSIDALEQQTMTWLEQAEGDLRKHLLLILRLTTACRALRVSHFPLQHPVSQMSSGERRCLEAAGTLCPPLPRHLLLLLEHPFAGQDTDRAQWLRRQMEALQAQGHALVIRDTPVPVAPPPPSADGGRGTRTMTLTWTAPTGLPSTPPLRMPFPGLLRLVGGGGTGKTRILLHLKENKPLSAISVQTVFWSAPLAPPCGSEATLLDLIGGRRDILADHFAKTPQSRRLNYRKALFLPQSPQSRCPSCRGRGTQASHISPHPSILPLCPACRGTGLTSAALRVYWNDLRFDQIWSLTLDALADRSNSTDWLGPLLQDLRTWGLGHLTPGESAGALSRDALHQIGLLGATAPRSTPTLFLLDQADLGLPPELRPHLFRRLQTRVAEGHGVILSAHPQDPPPDIPCVNLVLDG